MKKKKKILLCLTFAICMISFIIIMVLVLQHKTIQLDNYTINKIRHINDQKTVIFKMITTFGSASFLIPFTFLLLVLKNKKVFLYTATNLIVSFSCNEILKLVFQRPRPSHLHLVVETSYSFPSGHSIVSCVYYGTLIYCIWKSNWNKKIKMLLTLILSAFICAIGISRIYLGVHYPTDVLGGFALGICYVILFDQIVTFKIKKS